MHHRFALLKRNLEAGKLQNKRELRAFLAMVAVAFAIAPPPPATMLLAANAATAPTASDRVVGASAVYLAAAAGPTTARATTAAPTSLPQAYTII
jgi:hypothetical protein